MNIHAHIFQVMYLNKAHILFSVFQLIIFTLYFFAQVAFISHIGHYLNLEFRRNWLCFHDIVQFRACFRSLVICLLQMGCIFEDIDHFIPRNYAISRIGNFGHKSRIIRNVNQNVSVNIRSILCEFIVFCTPVFSSQRSLSIQVNQAAHYICRCARQINFTGDVYPDEVSFNPFSSFVIDNPRCQWLKKLNDNLLPFINIQQNCSCFRFITFSDIS